MTPRAGKNHRRFLENDLKNMISYIELVLQDIENGEPEITLAGYRYPEEFETLINSAEYASRLEYARKDLINSSKIYYKLSDTLKEMGNKLLQMSKVLDERDEFIIRDLDVLKTVSNALPKENPIVAELMKPQYADTTDRFDVFVRRKGKKRKWN